MGWDQVKAPTGGPYSGLGRPPPRELMRTDANGVSPLTPKIEAMGPAKTAIRKKKKTTAAQTTAILSRRRRPNAICIGDLPVISLARELLGSSGGASSLRGPS